MTATTARPARPRCAVQRRALLAVAVSLVTVALAGGTLGTGVASASDVDVPAPLRVTDPDGPAPDPTEAEPTDPVPTSAAPVHTDPDPADPAPVPTDPDPADPAPVPSDPGPTDPDPPGPSDPGPTDPDPTRPVPEPTAPDGTEPDGPGPDDTGVVPARPRDLTVTVLEGDTVVIGWSAPASAGSSPVTGYSVTLDGSDAVTTGVADRTARFTGLPAGEHIAAVAAVNSAGTGPSRSIELTIPGPAAIAPSAPTSVTVTQAADGQLTLTWDEPADPGSKVVEAYEVSVREVGTTGAEAGDRGLRDGSGTRTHPADARNAVLVGLLPERTYALSVAARSDAGIGAEVSLQRVVERLDVASAPRDLTVAQTAPGQLTLTFEAPQSAGSSAVDEYVVAVAGPDGPRTTWHGAGTRVVVLDGLGAGTHDVRVRAINSSGPGTPAQSSGTVLADWTVPAPGAGPPDVPAQTGELAAVPTAERETPVAIRAAAVLDVRPAPGGGEVDAPQVVAAPAAVPAAESGGISLLVLLLLGAVAAMAASRLGGGEEEL